MNIDITYNIISNNRVNWNYDTLCYITWDIIEEHSEEFNDYYYISSNPNITWNIIDEHPDKG